MLQNHASDPVLCKKSCVILRQLLKESDDPQLPYRMVEAGCAEALQLIIEAEPEKDDETKQLVLEILNYLFGVRGVLHKVVAKHGKGVLKMFMNTTKPKLAKNVIDCLHHTAGEGLEELDNESLARMNALVDTHKNDPGVNHSGSLYIKNLFQNSSRDRVKTCGVTVRDIVKSFGPYNMDEAVFRNLDVAIDMIGSDQEFYQVLEAIQKNPNSDDFWIMSHLVDLPSIDIQSKRDQLNSILQSADSKNLVASLNSEVCFFMKELHRAHPAISKDLMKDKSSLIKKVMDEIDHLSGPHKFLGLQVLEQNIDLHGKFMRENDIIKKAEKWIKECESPKDMVNILNFIEAFCDDEELKDDMLKAKLDTLAINKCLTNFPHEADTFDALTKYMDRCVTGHDDINNFCNSGNMNNMVGLASSLVDDMKNFDRFIEFTVKMFDVPNVSPKLYESFNDLTKLFCTRFEKRVFDFFDQWFKDRSKKEIWSHKYRPEFLECIVTDKERLALKKLMAKQNIDTFEAMLHKFALGEKGMDALTHLSQHVATFVCFLAKEEPEDMVTINCRVPLDDSVQALRNNLEFITDKVLKNRVVSRYLAMFCILLPHFKQKAYIKKIANKRSEFCCQELINFVEYATNKQPLVPFYLLSAYGLYTIPEDLKPELPKHSHPDGEEDREKDLPPLENPLWTPLTFILNDDKISTPISDFLVKNLKKKGDQQNLVNFMGFLSLISTYQFGTLDTDLLLSSSLLTAIVSQVDDESLDVNTAISAIHTVDSWCENSEKAILKLNSMGSYDKLLRYMNNLRNQDNLKLVISSLLQKLANFNDGNQLELDLERLVKKCKDYEEIVATKADEKREDVLNAYNDLSGLLQIQKAQQFCVNKQLQSTVLNTLAQELKRKPEELLSKGLIVNYQDLLNKLLASGNILAPISKAKPEDIANLSHILRRSLEHWKNDPAILTSTLDLIRASIKKPGQLDFTPEASQKIFNDLEALKQTYRSSPEILESIREVQAMLELPKEKAQEPPAVREADPVPAPRPADEPERVPHTPEPFQTGPAEQAQTRVEDEPQPDAPHTDHTEPEDPPVQETTPEEPSVEDIHAPPAQEEIEQQEKEKEELKANFVTEEIFQDTQKTEADAQKVIEESKVKEEEPQAFEEEIAPTIETPEAPEATPQPPANPEDEWNLSIENDRQRALALLATKAENPEEAAQDGLIYKVVLLAEELDCDELILAIFYAKWIAKLTSIQNIAHYSENPTDKLKANLERFPSEQELLKHTCHALANLTLNNPNQIPVVLANDIITVIKTQSAAATDSAVFGFFGKAIQNLTQTDENKIAVSQKGVIKVFGTYLKLKDSAEGPLKAVFKAVNSLCNTKVSCPMNVEKTDFIEVLVDFAAHVIRNVLPVCLVLETFGFIFKFGGEKVRTRAIELGATEFYSE